MIKGYWYKTVLVSIAIIILLVQTTLIAGAVGSGKTVLIMSHDKGPYHEVRSSIAEAFGQELEEIILSEKDSDTSKVLNLEPGMTKRIIAMGKLAVEAADKAATAIPVFYSLVYDKVAFQKRNAAGILIGIGIEEQIKLLRALFPERKNITLIFNPRISGVQVNLARKLAAQYGFEILAAPVDSRTEIKATCQRFNSSQVDLFLLVADPTVVHPESIKIIAEYTKKNKIPLIGLSRFHVDNGAMMAFSVDFKDIGKQLVETIKADEKIKEKTSIIAPRKIDILVNKELKNKMKIKDMKELSGIIYIK